MANEKTPAPTIRVRFSAKDIVLEVASGIGILLGIIILTQYPDLPDTIPRHFGASGAPDAWGSKKSILVLPLVSIIMYIGLTILNRYPHIFNYPFEITEQNAVRQYEIARSLLCALKAEIVWVFTYIEWRTIQVASDQAVGLGPLFLPIFLVLVFGTIGLSIFRAYRAR